MNWRKQNNKQHIILVVVNDRAKENRLEKITHYSNVGGSGKEKEKESDYA